MMMVMIPKVFAELSHERTVYCKLTALRFSSLEDHPMLLISLITFELFLLMKREPIKSMLIMYKDVIILSNPFYNEPVSYSN